MSLRSAAFAAKSLTVKRAVHRVHQDLLAQERMPLQELTAMQDQLAGDIVRTAMRISPFYRRTYGALGIDPTVMADPAAWADLPILDRATVKAHGTEIRTPEATPRAIRPATTGGSTGEPLRTLHDARVPTLPLAWRMYSWWGVAPHDNLARIGRWSFSRRDALKNGISWWPSRQLSFDASLLTAENMTTLHQEMLRVRPRLIEGYTGALVELADHLARHGQRIPTPRAIATTASPLTASARARIEEVFGAPVYDEYRGSEVGWMAGECQHQDGLHIFADARRIEVVDEDGRPAAPGEVGDLVVTDLRNRVFPVIRYRTGDRGALREAPCPCGRTLPMMEQPQGRTVDTIRLPSGDALAQRITSIFSKQPDAVRKFQLHQYADYSITVRVVIGDGADARSHIEAAIDDLRGRVHGEVPVRLEYLETLPYTGGKTRFVISELQSS